MVLLESALTSDDRFSDLEDVDGAIGLEKVDVRLVASPMNHYLVFDRIPCTECEDPVTSAVITIFQFQLPDREIRIPEVDRQRSAIPRFPDFVS
jgi:hypothetical protein